MLHKVHAHAIGLNKYTTKHSMQQRTVNGIIYHLRFICNFNKDKKNAEISIFLLKCIEKNF